MMWREIRCAKMFTNEKPREFIINITGEELYDGLSQIKDKIQSNYKLYKDAFCKNRKFGFRDYEPLFITKQDGESFNDISKKTKEVCKTILIMNLPMSFCKTIIIILLMKYFNYPEKIINCTRYRFQSSIYP